MARKGILPFVVIYAFLSFLDLRAKLQALGAGNGESYVEILERRGLSELIMRVGMAMF